MSGERIAIYGGTFDPLHLGHFRVAKALIGAFRLDRLLFVPAFVPPHKRGLEISAAYHRYAMIALATAGEPQMLVSPIELVAPARPYTIETLERLQKSHSDAELFFVMGVDSFSEVTLWREHTRLLSEHRIVVVARPGYGPVSGDDDSVTGHLGPDLEARVVDLRGGHHPSEMELAEPHIYLTDFVAEDISATQIRSSVAERKSIDHLVPPPVLRYIEKYGLYQQSV